MNNFERKFFSFSISQFIVYILSILTGIIFTRLLSKAEYGTYVQTFLSYDLFQPLICLGLPTSIVYFISKSKDSSKKIVLEILIILLTTSILFSIFLFFGGTKIISHRFNNPLLIKNLKYIIFYPIYTIPIMIGPAIWIYQNRQNTNLIYNLCTNLFLSLAIIVVIVNTENYEYAILIKSLLPILYFPIALYLIFNKLNGNWVFPEFYSILNIIKQSIPISFANIIGSLAIQISSLIVANLSSIENFSIYSIGAKDVPFIGIITSSISILLLSEMRKLIIDHNVEKALILFRNSCFISSSLLIPIMFFLFLYSKSFIVLLYSNAYTQSYIPFSIYLLTIPVRVINYSTVFIAFGKNKQMMLRSFVDLFFISILSFFFTRYFGIFGTPFGLVMTLYLWTVPFNIYILSKEFKCSFISLLPVRKISKIFFISFISILIPFLVSICNLNYVTKISISFVIFSFTYLILLYKLESDHFLFKIFTNVK